MKHILLKDILIHVLKLQSAYSLHQKKKDESTLINPIEISSVQIISQKKKTQ